LMPAIVLFLFHLLLDVRPSHADRSRGGCSEIPIASEQILSTVIRI
jgi:hypothetical protein